MARTKNAGRLPASTLLLILCASILVSPAAASSELDVYWKDGLNFKNAEAGVSMKIGGRILNDWGWFPPGDDYRRIEDATEFRRARIYLSGDLGSNIFFKSQIDFGAGEIGFKDMYMGLKGIPVVGRFLVGQMKEPYSLEEITSSNYITMMERSPIAVFDSDRNTGFMLQNSWVDKRLLASVGVFRNTNDNGSGAGYGDYNWSARVSGLPWEDQENRRYLHLGVSGSLRKAQDGIIEYRARPSSHFAPRMLETDEIAARDFTLGALEAAVVVGPVFVQTEWKTSRVDAMLGEDPRMSGYYVMAGWFLTGESRPYKHSTGCFDRVRPLEPLGEGAGAWELAFRFANVDLSDGNGGEMDDYVVGLNWYANNNARVMLNYVWADAGDRGKFRGFQTRFSVYF